MTVEDTTCRSIQSIIGRRKTSILSLHFATFLPSTAGLASDWPTAVGETSVYWIFPDYIQPDQKPNRLICNLSTDTKARLHPHAISLNRKIVLAATPAQFRKHVNRT
jgi:hypothetical protein